MIVGLSGGERNASVALGGDGEVLGVCRQERITRVRAAGFNATGLPDEALEELLRCTRRQRSDITAFVAACPIPANSMDVVRYDHHRAHAALAFRSSSFDAAAVVICDDEAPEVTVWDADGAMIKDFEWPWRGDGFATIYSRLADAIGYSTREKEQRLEALARLNAGHTDERIAGMLSLDDDATGFEPRKDHEALVAGMVNGAGVQRRSELAAALQNRLGDLLVSFISAVRRRLPERTRLCLGGSLFYNSYFNARIKRSGIYENVFVPTDAGNAGLSVGAVLEAIGGRPRAVSPFLGPSYTPEEIKGTLDNCKLTYQWASESESIDRAVRALQKGLLVAWFDDGMEWGPRALGARCILASPFSPYVLDNLNRFLKQREPWRGYALTGTRRAINDHFDGPADSPFMECDYVPRDRGRFQHVLPGPFASVRVQTVADRDGPPRFRTLLDAFGAAAGLPILVNTSFNGFREPIVCSPRDAVRVFYGSGLDVLVFNRFVISK